MAASSDLQRPRPDRRSEAVHFHGIARAGAQIVECDAHLPRRRDRVAMGAQQLREIPQYLQHFPLLVQLGGAQRVRSEEHTSELQSQSNLVCRLLLEKKNKT